MITLFHGPSETLFEIEDNLEVKDGKEIQLRKEMGFIDKTDEEWRLHKQRLVRNGNPLSQDEIDLLLSD